MKILSTACLMILLFCSFTSPDTLKGTWEYVGDIYNGKTEGAPTTYTLQRKYDDTSYSAIVLEKGYKPEIYETGKYSLINADTCLETQTWCSQTSGLIGKTIRYHYTLSNDTLTLNGTLPNGTIVTEYWKHIK